jgi:hypothetical protein
LGAPAYDEHFNVFAAPLAVDLAATGARVNHRPAFSVPLPTSSAA